MQSNRFFMLFSALLFLGLSLVCNAAQRPNVIFILTDDQRDDTLTCYNPDSPVKTPNIDRLANEGVLFENMFVTTSLCSPSRASFLSGLYAHAHGVVNNFTDYPHDLASFPKHLQEVGYKTAYIGKWHMGEQDDSKRPGFDYWATHKGQGQYFDTTFNIVPDGQEKGKREVLKGYYTTRITDLAVDWMQKIAKTEKKAKTEQPFLLILGHKAPHTPFTPEKKYEKLLEKIPFPYPESAFTLEDKPKWVQERLDTWHGIYGPLFGFREKFPDRSKKAQKHFEAFVRAYLSTIASVDVSTGRIYDELKKLGKLENTLILFAGDNGFFLGEHGMTDKRTMHEPSIRVPLLARYPREIRAGQREKKMVLSLDVAPTVLDFCSAPPLKNIHGKSWRPLVSSSFTRLAKRRAERDWRKSWIYVYNYEKQFPYTPNVRGVRTDTWKYVHYPHGDGTPDRHKAELYNLAKDPGELKNLIDDARYAGEVKRLQRELERQLKATGASPDKMPIDEGVKQELPDAAIR